MQHRIPDHTIYFYCNMCNVIDTDKTRVVKRKFMRPTILHPMRMCESAGALTSVLLNHYVSNFIVEDGKVDMPAVVFTTRADHAQMIVWMLRLVAKEM